MSIYCKTIGSGKSVVLLHGWGFSSAIMQSFAEKLAQQYRITLIDLPGFGKSKLLANFYSLDGIAEIILPFIPRNSTLIGWSLGGLIALRIAYLYPANIDRLVGMASTPCFVASSDWPGVSLDLLLSFEKMLSQDFKLALKHFSLLQVKGLPNRHKGYQFIMQYSNKKNENIITALLMALKILRESDLRWILPKLKCPMQFILSVDDAIVPIALKKHIEILAPNAEVVTISNAGHLPFLFQHEQTFNFVEKFLKKLYAD